jgi:hypothetical protein
MRRARLAEAMLARVGDPAMETALLRRTMAAIEARMPR